MTNAALTEGLSLLLTLWPHRASSPEMVAALHSIYLEALTELTDESFLAACHQAVRSCTHFPMPVELRDLAEGAAEATSLERIQTAEQQRIGAAHADIRRLLTAGTVTEDQAEANRHRYDRMVSDTLLAIREAGDRTRRDRRHDWRHERQANRNRRIAAGHWDAPPPTPND